MNLKEYNLCVDQYADNIYRFVLKNLKDRDDSKDIVQDTFEKLWKKHKEIDSGKVKSYLFASAYHTMIDWLRKTNRQEAISPTEAKKHHYSPHYYDVGEILNLALSKLPADQKSVILLRDYEGYSYKEISDITNLSETQVKVYIYRARLSLKNYLVSIETLV